MKLSTQHYFVYILLCGNGEIENNSHMHEITCYVLFKGFLGCVGTFSHKVVPTWFVFHETRHKTLFYIYYCVEVIRIENNNHKLEITC